MACTHPHVPNCFDPRMPILSFSCSFWSSCPYCPSSKSTPFGKPWDVQSDKGSLKIMSHSKGSGWWHFRTFHFSFPLLVCKYKWGRQEGVETIIVCKFRSSYLEVLKNSRSEKFAKLSGKHQWWIIELPDFTLKRGEGLSFRNFWKKGDLRFFP